LSLRSVNKRGYFQKEVKVALEEALKVPTTQIFIIPVYLEVCKVSDTRLDAFQRVKLYSGYYRRGLKDLLDVLCPTRKALPGRTARILSLMRKRMSLADFHRKSDKRKSIFQALCDIYYDIDILEGPEGPFPVGFIPLSPRAVRTPDRLAGKLVINSPDQPLRKQEVISALQKRGASLWDGITFSLYSVIRNRNGKVSKLKAYFGSYFDMVSSADYLDFEYRDAYLTRSRVPRILDLPARSKALSSFRNPKECLCSGGGIDAALAISTLIVYKRDNTYWLMCEQRSKKTTSYFDLYHVIPSFMFQPVTKGQAIDLFKEWDVTHNIYREYLEELFNVKEVYEFKQRPDPQSFHRHPNLKYLKRLLGRGCAELFGTGLIFNLLTHRPELCTVLLIHAENWYKRQENRNIARAYGLRPFNLNEEFIVRSGSRSSKPRKRLATTFPLDDPRWSTIVKPWQMVPPGGASLILGAKAVCHILHLREPSWLKAIRILRAKSRTAKTRHVVRDVARRYSFM
jgi:hypothetical protein